MKKYTLLMTAFAALIACTEEGLPGSTPAEDGLLVPMTFTALQEDLSKTSLASDFSVLWSSSDKVTLFAETGAAGNSFSVASTEDGGRRATFSGLSPTTSNGYYYALAPASEAATLVTTGGTVLAQLPSAQTGVENSFDPQAHLALARVNTQADEAVDILRFKNVGALLSFTVPGNYINRVRIESRDGAVAMTGPANINYNDGDPSVSPTTASKNYVEVSVPTGSIGKKYYAMVYPGEYSKGFVVSFYTSSNAFNRYTSSKALMLERNANVRLIERNWATSDDRDKTVSGTELIAPVISSGGAVSASSASITFSCASGKRDTYKFYLREATSMGDGTQVGTLETGSGQYGSYSHTFTGLTTGVSYDLGVSAACTGESGFGDSPITWLEDITINAAVSEMTVSISSAAASYYNFVVNYTLDGVSSTGVEHGLIFSYSSSSPTCGQVGAAGKLPGPALSSTGKVSLMQCVPNSVLRVGEPCHVRAYCYDPAAGNYVYSPVTTLTLPAQPSGYSINSEALASPSTAIQVSSFKADGRYNGYCATASLSAVRLGVHNAPLGAASAKAMSAQLSESGALVLVNGQIFGTQGNIGLAYSGGALRYNNSSDDGISACSSYGNSYSTWQPITRAILGVDASGVPGAYWCSLSDGTAKFYDRPIPAGTAVYSASPGPALTWSPAEALSTGPMLLYDGKVCVSEDRLASGVYYTNYELWETTSGNIYGSSRQRTAIGYDNTGKIYLVVVTSNITLTDLARVLKGLGCTYAMNLDGGGSTQMTVSGTGNLTSNTRAVKSTVGFFAK